MRLAVYGTLRKGKYNNSMLSNSEYIGQKMISLPFKMVDLGSFPALTPDDKYNYIVVDIYDVDEDIINRVDALEGHPKFYNRIEIDDDGIPTYIYIIPNKLNENMRVSSGDWVEHTKERGGYYERI